MPGTSLGKELQEGHSIPFPSRVHNSLGVRTEPKKSYFLLEETHGWLKLLRKEMESVWMISTIYWFWIQEKPRKPSVVVSHVGAPVVFSIAAPDHEQSDELSSSCS